MHITCYGTIRKRVKISAAVYATGGLNARVEVWNRLVEFEPKDATMWLDAAGYCLDRPSDSPAGSMLSYWSAVQNTTNLDFTG